jgi:membrane-bound ClpP family serine protease
VPNARVSPWLLGGVAAALAVFFGFVVGAVMKARQLPRAAGIEAMEGETGVAVDDLNPAGRVRVLRENWSAQSVGPPISRGSTVRVVEVRGLRLVVEPARDAAQEVAPGGEALPATSRREGELAGDSGAGQRKGGAGAQAAKR